MLEIIYEAMLRYLDKCLCWNDHAINSIIIALGCALFCEQEFLWSVEEGLAVSMVTAPVLVLLNSYVCYNSVLVPATVSSGPRLFM